MSTMAIHRLLFAGSALFALALGCTTAPPVLDAASNDAANDIEPRDLGPQRADTDGVDASSILVPVCALSDHGTIDMLCFDPTGHTSGVGWRPFCDASRAPDSLQPLGAAYCRSDGSDGPGHVSCVGGTLANDPSYLYCIPTAP